MLITDFCQEFKEIMADGHETMKANGFWDNPSKPVRLILMMIGEIAEGHEAFRKGNHPDDKVPQFDGLSAEIADTFLRIGDTSAGLDLPIFEELAHHLVEYLEPQLKATDFVGAFNEIGTRLLAISDNVESTDDILIDDDLMEAIGNLYMANMAFKSTKDTKAIVIAGWISRAMQRLMFANAKHELRVPEAILAKKEFNKTRERKHGKKF